jgi:hypothetical protein
VVFSREVGRREGERESERGDGGVGDDDGGERETKELALSTNSLAFSSFVNSDY